MTNPPGAMPPLPEPAMRLTNFDGEKVIERQALWDEEQVRAYSAPLIARVAELEADAERFQGLIRSLDWDGNGYWLPEICIRSRDFGEDSVPYPSIEEIRTAIDAAIAAKD